MIFASLKRDLNSIQLYCKCQKQIFSGRSIAEMSNRWQKCQYNVIQIGRIRAWDGRENLTYLFDIKKYLSHISSFKKATCITQPLEKKVKTAAIYMDRSKEMFCTRQKKDIQIICKWITNSRNALNSQNNSCSLKILVRYRVECLIDKWERKNY